MNSREAAAALGVTPKLLRRYLRSNPDWSSAGLGGKYDFSPDDITKLARALSPSRPPYPDGFDWMNIDQGVPVEVMIAAKNNPVLRAQLRARRRARRAKLGNQMRALGIITTHTFERSWR